MPPRTSNTDNVENGQVPHDASKPHEDVPACQSCRKKKARCSREQPCSECIRFNVDCVYDERRMKPGLRTGAVDQLYRRIETLENMFLGQEMLWQTMWKSLFPNCSVSELGERPSNIKNLARRREELQTALLHASSSPGERKEQRSDDTESISRPAKRQRGESTSLPAFINNEIDIDSILTTDFLTELVDFYFINVHPWIPLLHAGRFRERVNSPDERSQISCILHAIIAVCVRFSQNPSLPDEETKVKIAEKSRQKVILDSTETFSVENLQALVIIAFETIGRGRGPSSWSIVGSMVGTVKQLQLGVEEDILSQAQKTGENLIRRMVFLSPSKCWSEAEERRRVFWTVFLMDRFSSVSTGWKASLTSLNPAGSRASMNIDSEDSIGGFAYNIEATESLALVTNFFLHHAWKLYLPPKWREASVLNADGVMDPNLTLAHITHNTAVILLHQGIAYPPPHWQNCLVKLPSMASAETCLEAASEIATIGRQFLLFSPIFTSPQFLFCLFIAGRMLLAHGRYNQVPVPSSLDTLITSLLEISERWRGRNETPGLTGDNLASSFAKRLIEAQNNSGTDPRPSLDIRQTAYSDESREQHPPLAASGASPSDPGPFPSMTPKTVPYAGYTNKKSSQESYSMSPLSLAFPPLPPAFQHDYPAFSRSDTLPAGSALLGNTAVSSQNDLSQELSQLPTPGQIISRYSGAQIES
ncbi:hypothetical protein N7507_004054 [Penicillium longicatenatum]|nr:hypothetical protein N7507_004054 [Penicillium longicatenatum]